jgi:uncharacterized Zn-finger protein
MTGAPRRHSTAIADSHHLPAPPVMLPGIPTSVDHHHVISQMVRRAASPGFERWWHRARTAGFCANPVQLTGTDHHGSAARVWTRCNNRRAVVCPSCSDLYARDTWQLVHAGITGGHHSIPATVADHPQVFLTLTAPSYGPVHSSAHRGPGNRGARCHDHPRSGERRCPHGNPLSCNQTHRPEDPLVGQPLCVRCYDYTGHVLFAWHLPELWRRFTITLRRALGSRLQDAGVTPDAVRISFVKVTEMQRRAIPHLHAVIRLDAPTEPRQSPRPPTAGVAAPELAGLVLDAARAVTLIVANPDAATDTCERTLRFGTQIDAQPLTTAGPADHDELTRGVRSGRTVAGYLAKYVTKSVAEFGVAVRRISPLAIPTLDVTPHVRAILTTITGLAEDRFPDMIRWLHTLGYRGHITTKSRRFSTTMSALRAHRAAWTQQQSLKHSVGAHYSMPRAAQSSGDLEWTFEPSAGHRTLGDLALITSAAHRAIEHRHTARDALRAHDPPEPPAGSP